MIKEYETPNQFKEYLKTFNKLFREFIDIFNSSRVVLHFNPLIDDLKAKWFPDSGEPEDLGYIEDIEEVTYKAFEYTTPETKKASSFNVNSKIELFKVYNDTNTIKRNTTFFANYQRTLNETQSDSDTAKTYSETWITQYQLANINESKSIYKEYDINTILTPAQIQELKNELKVTELDWEDYLVKFKFYTAVQQFDLKHSTTVSYTAFHTAYREKDKKTIENQNYGGNLLSTTDAVSKVAFTQGWKNVLLDENGKVKIKFLCKASSSEYPWRTILSKEYKFEGSVNISLGGIQIERKVVNHIGDDDDFTVTILNLDNPELKTANAVNVETDMLVNNWKGAKIGKNGSLQLRTNPVCDDYYYSRELEKVNISPPSVSSGYTWTYKKFKLGKSGEKVLTVDGADYRYIYFQGEGMPGEIIENKVEAAGANFKYYLNISKIRFDDISKNANVKITFYNLGNLNVESYNEDPPNKDVRNYTISSGKVITFASNIKCRKVEIKTTDENEIETTIRIYSTVDIVGQTDKVTQWKNLDEKEVYYHTISVPNIIDNFFPNKKDNLRKKIKKILFVEGDEMEGCGDDGINYTVTPLYVRLFACVKEFKNKHDLIVEYRSHAGKCDGVNRNNIVAESEILRLDGTSKKNWTSQITSASTGWIPIEADNNGLFSVKFICVPNSDNYDTSYGFSGNCNIAITGLMIRNETDMNLDEMEDPFQPADKIIYQGQSVGILPKTSYPGFDLEGWYSSYYKDANTGDQYYDYKLYNNSIVSECGLKTLYAKWENAYLPVKLDAGDGGSVVPDTIYVQYLSAFGTWTSEPYGYREEGLHALPVPVRPSSTFVKWVDADGNPISLNELTPSKLLTTDPVTLSAIYDVEKKKITYMANGGKFSEGFKVVQEAPFGEYAILNTTEKPVRDGYQFVGWSESKNNPNIITKTLMWADKKIWAYYIPNSYYITYKADSEVYDVKLVAYDEAVFLLDFSEEYPLRNFKSWEYSKTGSSKIYFDSGCLVCNLTKENNGSVTLIASTHKPTFTEDIK